jgi:acyl-coenzyme A synthetase/AMP-(fatty) acid ligase
LKHQALIDKIWNFAEAAPEKIIVQDHARSWTWRQLLWHASDYASSLSNIESPIVPILVGRTVESIAAMLGALIASKGFSPLSAEQPEDRLLHCLAALNSIAIIIPERTNIKHKYIIDELKVITPLRQDESIGLPLKPQMMHDCECLYVIFTSGSTGKPKGVIASCGNIENTLLWSCDYLDWGVNDVIGCCTNLYFDISMFDIFTMLYFNVPLAIYSNPSDVIEVANETSKFGITSIFGVPSFFGQILRHGLVNDQRLLSLKRIIVGGDFFPPSQVIGWTEAREKTQIFNAWGPTETSIVNTFHLVGKSDIPSLRLGHHLPVGKAHERMPFEIVDEKNNLIRDANQRGEILMFGPCVTTGYLGDTQRTKEAYILINGRRAYRTQDIGYVDENGNLFIVGRIGATVKVSGYRIDLGEVETAAVSLNSIHAACAFVVKNENYTDASELWMVIELDLNIEKIDIYLVKKTMRKSLSQYMVPKRIFVIERMLHNSNGKIDRNAVSKFALSESKK